MSDYRTIIQTIISSIEKLPLEILQQHPELERSVPKLYETLQIPDVCDHKFVNGQCICGEIESKA